MAGDIVAFVRRRRRAPPARPLRRRRCRSSSSAMDVPASRSSRSRSSPPPRPTRTSSPRRSAASPRRTPPSASHRRGVQPDHHQRHGRAPPRHLRGADAARVRRRGRRRPARGRVPGDHHRLRAKMDYRHVKQTGGRGQFAHIVLDVTRMYRVCSDKGTTSAMSTDPARTSLKASTIRTVRDLFTVTFKRRSDAPPSMDLGGGGRLWAIAAGMLRPAAKAITPQTASFCIKVATMLSRWRETILLVRHSVW